MIPDPLPQEQTVRGQTRLLEALHDPLCYSHPVRSVRVLETHISLVVLTGTFAYKIKKAVDLGFLDFTTLEKRRWFCDEELRLNSRLAPELYLDVVPISGTPTSTIPAYCRGSRRWGTAGQFTQHGPPVTCSRCRASISRTTRFDNAPVTIPTFGLRPSPNHASISFSVASLD